MITFFVITLSKILLKMSRLLGNSGSALPGLVAEKIRPDLSREILDQLEFGTIVVTGTNGKTTTTKIIVSLLEAHGYKVFTNKTGSNFTRGILSSLVEKVSFGGRLDCDIAVLELDEAYSRVFARLVRPRLVVALNVMRDQLDRFGEIDKTAELIGEAISYADGAVLNADDPPVLNLAKNVKPGSKVTYFGAHESLKKQLPTDDELLGGGQKARRKKSPNKRVVLRKATPGGLVMDIDNIQTSAKFQLEGIHNGINAAAALATILHLQGDGLLVTDVIDGLDAVSPAFGRGEKIQLQGRDIHLALVKNPSGFNQNLRAFVNAKPRVILIIINDDYADSRDVSWLWDVEFNVIGKYNPTIITSGTRAYDMALRLYYENVEVDGIELDIKVALEKALSAGDSTGDILVFPTYTAMLELRKALKKYSVVEDIW